MGSRRKQTSRTLPRAELIIRIQVCSPKPSVASAHACVEVLRGCPFSESSPLLRTSTGADSDALPIFSVQQTYAAQAQSYADAPHMEISQQYGHQFLPGQLVSQPGPVSHAWPTSSVQQTHAAHAQSYPNSSSVEVAPQYGDGRPISQPEPMSCNMGQRQPVYMNDRYAVTPIPELLSPHFCDCLNPMGIFPDYWTRLP